MFAQTDKLYMLDIETTGLIPTENHMTSICLRKFCLGGKAEATDVDIVNHRVAVALTDESRENDTRTMEFRANNMIDRYERALPGSTFSAIYAAMKGEFTLHGSKNCYIIANHPEFDVSFLQSYCRNAGLPSFWHYSNVLDLHSLIYGMGIDRKVADELLKSSPTYLRAQRTLFGGIEQPHSARFDCFYQIELLKISLALLRHALRTN